MIRIPLDKDIIECTILRRVNRFVVEVLVNNRVVYVHNTNTGRLSDIIVKGRKGYCIPINGSKLKYRIIGVEDGDKVALIDTNLQERVFTYLASSKYLAFLKDCRIVKRNAKIDNQVIDFMFKCSSKYRLVEIKSAVLRIGRYFAGYPDCPTLRGRKQVLQLINWVLAGGIADLVFIAGLPSVKGFTPYRKGDPIVADLIILAGEAGVGLHAIGLYLDPSTAEIIVYNTDLPIIFNG